ncbi:MAG: hypothetical protein EBT33_09425, partial [Betaproteobacteria bacterium]|nr:hypothetical protein [Betaproteobacteria bacterium]
TAATGTTVAVDELLIGGSSLTGFIGVNGGTANATGVSLSGVTLGLALYTERVTGSATAKKWTSAQASVASASFTGIDDLTVNVSSLSVEVNRAASDKTLVDYGAGKTVRAVKTGPTTSLDLRLNAAEGELTRATGNLKLDLFGFVQADGGFGIVKKSGRVRVTDNPLTATIDESANLVDVDMLLIGGTGLTGFAGINGGRADETGLRLSGVELGVALYTEKLANNSTASARRWTTAQATATNAAFGGIDGLVLSAQSLSVEVNRAATDKTVVDYGYSDPEDLTKPRKSVVAVPTGPTSSLALSIDGARGDLLRASAFLNIDVFGFFAVRGNFAIDKSDREIVLNDAVVDAQGVTTRPASVVKVTALNIGASDVFAFAGVGGGFDAQGELKSGAIGLQLSEVDFGLAVLGEKLNGQEPAGTQARRWTSLQAQAGSAGLTGIDGLTLSADTLTVDINRPAADASLVDYKARAYTIDTGTSDSPSSLTLSLDGSEGALLRARGNLKLDVFGFVQASGAFGIEKKTGSIRVADKPSTQNIDESATAVNVDMLLVGASGLSAFAGVNGGQSNALGLSMSGVDMGLALFTERLSGTTGTPRKWTSLQASVESAQLGGIDGLTASMSNLTVSVNRQATDGTVVDYSLDATKTDGTRMSAVKVLTGPTSDLELTLDGKRGDLLEARGKVDLDVFGFVQLSGEFAFERASAPMTVTLADGTQRQASALKVGASNLRAFAGVDGGTANAMGLELSGVEFGLALLSDVNDATRNWTSLQAKAQSAALVGISGLVAAGDTLSIEVNRAGKAGDAVVDFSRADPTDQASPRRTALTVATGLTSSLELGMSGAQGDLLRASGNLRLDVFGFFQASGAFAVERRDETVWLNDGVVSEDPTKAKAPTKVNARLLTIGGTGIDAFAGVNGGSANAMGLKLEGVDFGLAMVSEKPATAGAAARKFTTLKAQAGSVEFVGIDGFEASASGLEVEINRGIKGTGGNPDTVIDYSAQQLEVLAGPTQTVTIDSDGAVGELTRASADFKLDVFGFAQLEGFLSFDQSTQTVALADRVVNASGVEVSPATQVQATVLKVGGSGVSAFVGINGGTEDRIGLAMSGADFGLALITDRADPSRKWTTLEASASAVSFDGIEGLTAKADTLTVTINRASKAADPVVDYSLVNAAQTGGARRTELSIKTGAASSTRLSVDGAEGRVLKAAGNLDIDLFGFVSVKGGFAVESRSQAVTLSDGSTIDKAQLITIGGSKVDAFAGINGGYDDATGALKAGAKGLSLGQVNFGLALVSDPEDPKRSFTTLQATAVTAELKGIEGLTAKAEQVLLNVNRGITLPAEPEVVTKFNTKLLLKIPVDLSGTLTLSRAAGTGGQTHAASTANATVLEGLSNTELIKRLTAAFESLAGIGAGNVAIEGNLYDGYTVEFINALAGKPVTDITASATPTAATSTVTTSTLPFAGVDEVKQVVVQSLRAEPPPVSVTVTTPVEADAGLTEISQITFTTPLRDGTYDVFFMDGGVVRQDRAPVAGVNELQRITVTGDRAAQPPAASATVTVVQDGLQGQPLVLSPTRLKLDTDIAQGTLVLSFSGQQASVELTAGRTAEATRTAIRTQLEAVVRATGRSVTAGDIAVTGDEDAGFTIVFGGTLAGLDFSGLSAQARVPQVTASVVEVAAGAAAVDRVVVQPQTVNTRLLLQMDAQAAGTLSFALNGTNRPANIAAGASDAAVMAAVKSALEGFAAVGAGNVAITGTRAAGYSIEFKGAQAGKDLTGLALSFIPLAATSTVSTLEQGGQQQTGSVSSGTQVNERQVIKFTNATALTGVRYTLSAGAKDTGRIDFSSSSPTQNRSTLQAALDGVYGAGNTKVTFDQTSTAANPIYFIDFIGGLAGQNVGQLSVSSETKVHVEITTSRQGQGVTQTPVIRAVPTVQRIALTGADAGGTIRIAFDHSGKTYTTAALPLSSSAADVQAALAALNVTGLSTAAAISVAGSSGNWTLTFGGGLSGQLIAPVKVTVIPLGSSAQLSVVERGLTRTTSETLTTPAVNELQRISLVSQAPGNFTLSLVHAGKTYTTSSLAIGAGADAVKSALEQALSAGGFAGAQLTVTARTGGYDVGFAGTLGGLNIAPLKVAAQAQPASAEVSVLQVGERSGGETMMNERYALTFTQKFGLRPSPRSRRPTPSC